MDYFATCANTKNAKHKILALVFIFLFGISIPPVAQGATAYFGPASGEFVDREIPVDVLVDTEGVAVNNVDMVVRFPNDLLEVISVEATHSVFSLWVGAPKFSNELGTITFTAGVPTPGFSGDMGQILSILFRVKNKGQATLTFSAVSIRANDGYGTDVYQGSSRAIYTLNPRPLPEAGPPKAPLLTEYPRELQTGDQLIVHGLTLPESPVTVWVQSGRSNEEAFQFTSDADGRFVFTYGKPVVEGIYRVWAEVRGSSGLASPSSEKISIEVKHPSIDRRLVATGVFGLLILVALGFVWRAFVQSRTRLKKETLEAESSVHQAFGSLRENRSRLEMFEAARTKRTLTEEEERIVAWLKRDLDAVEKTVEKEIVDIEEEIK